MDVKEHYRQYVEDKTLIDRYNAYQVVYKAKPRESDKISVEILREILQGRENVSVLDIACSTGNFLRHAQKGLPGVAWTGADLAEASIAKCREDPELARIEFEVADMLDLSKLGPFDAVVANAVTFLFEWPDYCRALASIFGALRPGGAYVGFELVHPFSIQDVKVIETNEWNPDGFTLRLRPMKKVEGALRDAGFEAVEFRPFVLPIDLPFPGHDADVVTYTRKDEAGERMAFRGVLYQPWCHIIARKAT